VTRRPARWLIRWLPLWVVASIIALSFGAAWAQTPAPSPPPPTPVVQPGGQTSPSPFPSTLRTPAPTTQAPEVGAGSAVLVDLDTGQVLFDLDRHERRPIASLTKIMTALLVVERAGLTDVVTVSEGAASGQVSGISGLGLVPGERLRLN
jgi:D-alanyl-D-alanine carboxypeptidase